MRIVIIGGGMAGWALAGHLRRRGRTPVLLERVPAYDRVGFSIALYPFSAGTLRETGLHDRYAEGALEIADYAMRDARGAELQRMSFTEVLGRIGGSMGALHRADLLALLAEGGAGTDVRMGTTVSAIEQAGDVVQVVTSDGERLEADVVVGADGIHSQTRALTVGDVTPRDWGMTAFTWWTPPTEAVGRDVVEHWGAGGLFGLYPIPGAVNAIAALPTPADAASMDQPAIRAHVRDAYAEYPEPVATALAHLDDAEVHLWPMVDARSPSWIAGRVALVGDAATAFLPTAGVGASNAMKSAAVLADELGRADARTVPQALSLWEQRMRKKVEANQEASRRLAKLMFVQRHTTARIRDLMLRHYPVEKIAEDVLRSNTTPF